MRLKALRVLLLGVLLPVFLSAIYQDKKKIKVGAFYFDGWSGAYPYHITENLVDSFPERKPKWGWITSSQDVVDAQIKVASSYGIRFFSFCWYYDKNKGSKLPLNRAVNFFRKSKYNDKMSYCIMVTNHEGFEVLSDNWNKMTNEWLSHFKEKSYLQLDGKPILVFFSVSSLVRTFGSVEKVRFAFDSLRANVIKENLKGVTIVACTWNDKSEINKAEACGFDLLSGYNYHSSGFIKGKQIIPIDTLINREKLVWNYIKTNSKLRYIPTLTLNWDPRPWAVGKSIYVGQPHYVGFSPNSVYRSVKTSIEWIKNSNDIDSSDKLLVLYAWNENGEGAWLTPSTNGINMGKGVKKAIKELIRD